MMDPKENYGSEGVLKGKKKPKDVSEGGSGGKMMSQMTSKGRPEILQAGRGTWIPINTQIGRAHV